MVTGHAKDTTTLLDLAARLAREVGQFVDQRLELFNAELKQEAARTVRSLGLLAAGAAGAGVGTMLLLLGLGLWSGTSRARGQQAWPSSAGGWPSWAVASSSSPRGG